MSYPNLQGKHAHEALVTPEESVRFWRRNGLLANFAAPRGVVLCYRRRLLRHVEATEAVEAVKVGQATVQLLRRTGNAVGVCGGFGIGAPAATLVMENLIALGTTAFVSIGAAGGLQADLRIGDIVVCTAAVRDEGVSHHYLPPAPYAHPSPWLTDRLAGELTRRGATAVAGPSWTIDAPYRETVEEARHFRAAGVRTVEMEAAALFAVAQVRGVAVAAALAVSDILAETGWDPRFEATEVGTALETLVAAAVTTLDGMSSPGALPSHDGTPTV